MKSFENSRLLSPALSYDVATMLAIMLVVFSFMWWITPNQALYVADSLYYVGSAQSLAQGEGYHCPMLIGNPANGFYPPLQSLYLSAAWFLNPVFPDNQIIIKALMLLLWSLAMAALFAVLKKGGLGRLAATTISLTVGTSAVWAYFVIHCFSDVLFSLLAFVATWLWIRPESQRLQTRIALTGIILALMYLTRIATFGFLPGAMLAAAVASYRLRTWKPLAWLSIPIVAAMAFWALLPRETVGYGPWFSEEPVLFGGYWGWIRHLISYCFFQSWDYVNGNHLFQNFSTDLPNVLMSFAPLESPVWEAIVQSILCALGLGFLTICAVGAYRSPQDRAVQAAVGTYILQILVWPFPLGFRGLLSLLPLFILWASRGAKLLRTPWNRVFELTAVVYLSCCLLSNLAGAPETHRLLDRSQMISEAKATGQWIQTTIPPQVQIASDFTLPIMHIYEASQHPIYLFPNPRTALKAPGLKISYFISYGGNAKGKIIGRKGGPRFKVIWESPHGKFQVLQVIRGSD